MARRTVALVLVLDVEVDVDDPLTNVDLTDAVLRDVGRLAGVRVPYIEAHDDLDAVLDEDTAARYRIGD